MALSADIVARLARRLADHAGFELSAWVVEARAEARMAELGLEPEAYVELIGSGRGVVELGALVEALRVGETSMFRHVAQFATLVDVVAPQLRARGRRAVQVWSAGCANGCEPYSLAIALARALPDVQLQIVATDLSEPALTDARANVYPRAVVDDVPEPYRDAFVEVDDDGGDLHGGGRVAVVPELARLVRFERANLADPRRGDTENGRFDIVWCRNVLIYFSAEARKRAIERLIASATFGGAIFVGYSESLRDTPGLEAVRAGEALHYIRKDPRDLVAQAHAVRPSSREVRHRTPTHGVAVPPPPVAIARASGANPIVAPHDGIVVLSGQPDAHALTHELAARLGGRHARVVVDLDGAELLDDTLAPVLRRATAAARAAGGEVVLRATRTGTQRWLARHGLARDEDVP